jgi:hypothetical protein
MKLKRKKMKLLIGIMLSAVALATSTQAQEAKVATRMTDVKMGAEIIASSSIKVVKNAPFSAEAISESSQVLPDGNEITRSVTTKMYRDSEGRFRREEMSGGSGGAFVGVYQMISILDPVEGTRFLLSPTVKTARRVNIGTTSVGGVVSAYTPTISPSQRAQIEGAAAGQPGLAALASSIIVQPGQVTVQAIPSLSNNQAKTESLGVREIEGVQAEGTRSVTTIPAGTIGNERPIESVYERWYSKDLQLIVFSKHTDPRFGEQTYRLTNISRSEPDRSLFTPSSDYKILTEPPAAGSGTGIRKQ